LPILAWLLLVPGCDRCGSRGSGGAPDPSPSATQRKTGGTPAETSGKKSNYRYRRAKGCAGCHPEHYEQWKRSLHALSHSEPIYDFYFIRASQDSGQKLETFCAGCHTPVAVRSGEIPFRRPPQSPTDTRVDRVAAEGVQCDFCHTLAGHHALQNAGYVIRASDVKRGPLPDAKPINHRAAHDPRYRTAEYCATCHQVVHPQNGIHLEPTYLEWKQGPYAKAGIVCQDCHMTDGLQPLTATRPADIGEPSRHPGKAAVMGKKRPHISRHLFVGPNLVFTDTSDPADHRARAERAARLSLLRRAGRVALRGQGVIRRDGKRLLAFRVTNTGAGHYLPTGVTELRELWLQVTLRDPAGEVVFRSGHPQADGNLPPGTVLYRTEVHDAEGRDTTLFWNTVKKVRDYRIPPLGHRDEEIPLPAGLALQGPHSVEAALRYRAVSPAGLAEAGVPPGAIPIPIVTIHRIEGTLAL
jgi:hypothetical protein